MRSRNLRSALTSVGAIFAFAILISLTASASAAQSTIQGPQCKGVLHGIVSDQQGRPVPGASVALQPLGVDLDIVLPEARANQSGEYRFTHVCPGRYTILPNGLKLTFPGDFKFLKEHRVLEAKLTDKKLMAQIPVRIPTRSGRNLPSR
jgi:hypothetical protein